MNTAASRLARRLFYAVALLTVVSCSGGGGSAAINTALGGNAVKGPVKNAEIMLVYFDELGIEVEIMATNAPVMTDVNGGFMFDTPFNKLPADVGPGILRTIGGTTDPDNGVAPTLEAVIPDLGAYRNKSALATRHLSTASSVAAGLLKLEVEKMAARPSIAVTNALIDRVEIQLGVDLDDDPTLMTSSTAAVNRSVDALLSLQASAANNAAINEYVDYLVDNLASTSGALDENMRDATTGIDMQAAFESPALAALFPDGPEELRVLFLAVDKAQIENDGLDSAMLTVSIHDGTGTLIPDPDWTGLPGTVEVKVVSGQAILGKETLSQLNDKFDVRLSSIWPGAVTVEASYVLQNGTVLTQTVAVEVVDRIADAIDSDAPKIVSSVAISNTDVIATFTEALRGGLGGAENPAFYSMTAVDVPGQPAIGAYVDVIDAVLLAPDYRSVLLTTQSQSGITYKLQTSNLRDLAGNTFESPSAEFQGVDPSSTTFVGIPPSGNDIVDSDHDGLSDSDELFGWAVTTIRPSGLTDTHWVTSDPQNEDTDGDGVTDNEEKHGAIDPRSGDTDGDTLTDDEEWNTIFSDALNQDTDGDGVQDGFEYKTFRTSPILADTDGDQISDSDEVSAGNRNPLVADLPSPRITVDNITLQLDTRFTVTNENGTSVLEEKQTEATLTSGEDKTFSTSNENSTKSTLEASEELQIGASSGGNFLFPSVDYSVQGTVGSKQGSEQGSTFTSGEESSRNSEESYHDSLTMSKARDEREAVTREVVGAAMKVMVTIDSDGDIPFTISNLELTAESQNPSDRRKMIPVASMVPENGSLHSVNIGTLGDTSRGPFVFTAVSVFPQQVEELMKNPRGLIASLANFDITDEMGRNFAYTSREVLDRTAGITFDLGDGRVESYRVATASDHDPATGRPNGITMERALSIIGLQRYHYIRDGGNGKLETIALAGDTAVAALDTSVEPGQILITSGADGVLQSTEVGGDDVRMDPDYLTVEQKAFSSIIDGGNGIVETQAHPDDKQEVAHYTEAHGDFTNTIRRGGTIITEGDVVGLQSTAGGDDVILETPKRFMLTKFRNVEANGEEARFWVLFSTNTRPGVDLDDLVIRAGEQYNFTYVSDKDGDGLFARIESLHNSSDLLPNTDCCCTLDPLTEYSTCLAEGFDDNCPSPRDFDKCDTLTDKEEIQEGWRVQLSNSPQSFPVFSNPNQGDSDRDFLLDHEERACKLDPRQRDTDLDGLTDWEELNGLLLEGGDPEDAVPMVSRDPITNDPVRSIPINYEAFNLGLMTSECKNRFLGFATDPLNADTDGDGVDDARELKLGLNPNDPDDGGDFLDDDGDGLPNQDETKGFSAIVNSMPSAEGSFKSNPIIRDSDGDLLPDLLERYLRSDPRNVDTDNDGITDTNEYKVRGGACVTETSGQPCVSFTDLRGVDSEFNFQNYLFKCGFADACNNSDIENDLMDAFARNFGTNLAEKDSDFDGLDDPDELFTSLNIEVNGGFIIVEAPSSDPLKADTDNDGIPDGVEVGIDTTGEPCNRRPGNGPCYVTNPRAQDTDGDGRTDRTEIAQLTDPTVVDQAGKVVTFMYTSIVGHEACDDAGDEIELQGKWRLEANIRGIVETIDLVTLWNCYILETGSDNVVGNPSTLPLLGSPTRKGQCTVVDGGKRTLTLTPGDSVRMFTDPELDECDGPVGTECDFGNEDDDLSPGVDRTFNFADIGKTPMNASFQHGDDGDLTDDLCATTTLRVECPLCE